MHADEQDTALSLIERLKRKAPETLDLIAADSEEEFEKAFDALLEKAVTQLERQKDNFQSLDEVGLSGVFAAALSMPGLTVTPEAHSNGHVDLFISANYCHPERIKLGEAKIYAGPAYHIKGLEQLFGRYTTGRETRGLLLVYYRDSGILDLVDKLRKEMDAKLPMQQQGKTADHVIQWSFLSKHKHTSGDDKEVGHIGCNLFSSSGTTKRKTARGSHG
jgi:hypothetical protein